MYFFQGIVWLKKYISIDLFICRNSFASREVSQEIRDEIDTLINEAAKDMLNHWTNTNRSLQVGIIARIEKWNMKSQVYKQRIIYFSDNGNKHT